MTTSQARSVPLFDSGQPRDDESGNQRTTTGRRSTSRVKHVDWSAVVIGAVPYAGSTPLGCWQVSRVLGRRRQVLFVEPPHSLAHGPRLPRLRQASDGSNVFVLTPTAPPAYDRPGMAELADRVIARQITRAADRCLTGQRALLTFNPRRGLLQVPYDVLLYWQRDSVELMARHQAVKWLDSRHQRLQAAADVITAVSPDLVQRSAADGFTAVLVPNGCDHELFSTPQARPSELPTDRVIIGFGGGVGNRIDTELLLQLVDARPDWLFVAVGEVVTELPVRSNMMLVGRRPYREMPAWLQAFDIGIVPYVEDARNRHSNPLKVLEYLAAGVPAVSTPIAALNEFAACVRLASGPQEFLRALDETVANPPSRQTCQAVARRHSWEVRTDVVEQLVATALNSHSARSKG